MENTINFTNAPVMGSLLASSPSVTAGTWISLDITSFVTGEGDFSVGLRTPGLTAIGLASRESGAFAPQLIIDLQ